MTLGNSVASGFDFFICIKYGDVAGLLGSNVNKISVFTWHMVAGQEIFSCSIHW
jgi:hypothetical protein